MRPKEHAMEQKAVKFTELLFGLALMYAYIKREEKAEQNQNQDFQVSLLSVFDILFLVPLCH